MAAIEISQVCKDYHGGVRAVHHVDIDIFQSAATVHEDENGAQGCAASEIVTDQLVPAGFFVFGNFRIPVARHVDDDETAT